MDVFGVQIPDKALTNNEIYNYVQELEIPKFREVFMTPCPELLVNRNVELLASIVVIIVVLTGLVILKA